jgi:RNA polymerase sigma factor (sigma-70 family)
VTAAARTGGRWRPAPFALLGDERLAQRVGAGDERAFAVVYERYHQILYRYCRSILHHDADAQDALQSSFAAAFAALRNGQRDAPMRPWLFRIAHNESISVLRRRRGTAELSAASGHGTSSVEEQAVDRAELSVLFRDLRELTDRQRSALVLRELSGLSHQEIAVALETSAAAAKQTIFEARQSLFEFAEGRAMACHEIRRTISDADGRALRSRRVRAHLRACGGCAAFAAAIPTRTGELRALAPALPAVAAAGLFGRTVIAAAGRGAGAGFGPLAAGAAAKTAVTGAGFGVSALTGAGFGANALAGMAVVASATAGVTIGVGSVVHDLAHHAAAGAHHHLAAPAPSRSPASATRSPAGRAAGPGIAPERTGSQRAGIRSGHAKTGFLRARHRSNSRTANAGVHRSDNGANGRFGTGTPAAVPGAGAGASSGADSRGVGWHGGPARVQSAPAYGDSAGAQAGQSSGNPAHAEAQQSSSADASQSSSHGHSASANSGSAGSGRPSWAASNQSAPGGSGKTGTGGSGETGAGHGRGNVSANAIATVGIVTTGQDNAGQGRDNGNQGQGNGGNQGQGGNGNQGQGTRGQGQGNASQTAVGLTSAVSGVVSATISSASRQSASPVSLPGSTTGSLRGHRVSS